MAAFEIVAVETDDHLHRYAAFELEIEPDNAHSLEELRDRRDRFPRDRAWLALQDGRTVAVAGCGEPRGHAGSSGYCWAFARVAPAARRQGIGQALYDRAAAHARERGRPELEAWVDVSEPDSVRFAERHGLREQGRIRQLALDLRGPRPDPGPPPDGVRIASLAELNGVERGLYEAALEGVPDMPALEPLKVGSFEEWSADGLVELRRHPGLTLVALVGDEVVGYGVIAPRGANGRIGQHRGTLVKRAHRGRGIARAIKAAQIRAAEQAGIERLITQNADQNVPMRRVNERLGYQSMPDRLWMRGPVPPA